MLDVALTVEHAPYVNVFGALDVENQMRIGRQRPATQAGKIQFVRVLR